MFYRKYRPQLWTDLDNKKICNTLGKTVLANDWVHAYLLIGTRGVGKTSAARLIAKTVNCTDRKKGEEPCNKCDSCREIISGSSLDVIEIDAASHTGVDDIRELRERVKLASTKGRYKVYIIDEAHMLSTSAFNALLKTLEEPPAHVIFVLATTDPQKLPETIISRCLVYDFGRATEEEILQKLKKISQEEKIKIEDKDLLIIAKRANGSHRDAQKILEQCTGSGASLNLERPNATNLLIFLAKKDRSKALAELEGYVQANGRIKDLIIEMIGLLRDELLEGKNVRELINKLIEANAMLRDSPIPSLPLELVIVEWCGEDSVIARNEETKQSSNAQEKIAAPAADAGARNDTLEVIQEKWPEIVAATKPHNHSLNAFLKAAKPKDLKDDCLIIEVAYKFHKEKLEEQKNRDILERVMFDIMKQNIRAKFTLRG